MKLTEEQYNQIITALDNAIAEKRRVGEVVNWVGPTILETLQPILEEIAVNTKINKADLAEAISQIQVTSPQVNIPPINIPEAQVTLDDSGIKQAIVDGFKNLKAPEVKIPTIKVPKPEVTVNVPPIKVPKIEWPADDLPIQGWVRLQGVDLNNPLPVQLRDSNGKPVNLFENLTSLVSSGGGGAAKIVKVSGVLSTVGVVTVNPDGEATYSSSGLTDTELRAAHLDVQQVSGAIDSVWVKGFDGTVAASLVDSSGAQYSGSNPLPVTGSVTLSSESITLDQETDSIATRQVSGFADSVYVVGSSGTVFAQLANADGTYRDTMPVQGTVAVSGITNSAAATILNGDGTTRDSWAATQAGTWNIGTVTTVTGVTNTVAASLVDSTGIQYSGDNPLPITGSVTLSSESITLDQTTDSIAVRQVSGFSDSVNVVTSIDLPALLKPSNTSTYAPTNATSTAYSSGLLPKGSAGTLYGISGYNSSTGAQFIQVHNKATAVADTDVPVVTFRVAPLSNFSFDFGCYGRYCSTGIALTNSSTGPTATTQAADVWYDCQYS